MLQYIAHSNETHDMASQVRAVVAAGCKWIQLNVRDFTDDDVRNLVADIKPLCDEKDVMLILHGKLHLAVELAVSGVQLDAGDIMPSKARMDVGPAAVVGVTAHTIDEVMRLRGLDVDYVTLSPYRSQAGDALDLDGIIAICTEMKEKEFELAVVVSGGVAYDDILPLLEVGANGVAVGEAVTEAEDMEAEMRRLLQLFPMHE